MAENGKAEQWRELAQQLRVDAVRSSAAAGSGHPTSSMSAADLAAVLLSEHLTYDFDNPDNPDNDHFVLSKGHASPLLYAMFKATGAVDDAEMLTFRKFGSRMQGHPTPLIPWVDVATGSLGQGLPIATGIALGGKEIQGRNFRVWVLCGDSEFAEGSIWEALAFASHRQLDNLTVILDVNRLGQRGETMLGWNTDAYADRVAAFGCEPLIVDGHDVEAIDAAFSKARGVTGKPGVVIAKTMKGRGVASVENRNGAHGVPIGDPEQAITELGGIRDIRVQTRAPAPATRQVVDKSSAVAMPTYELGAKVATRKAYGEALTALGRARSDVVALDAEVSNSTHADMFAAEFPNRFVETYIAEQLLVGASVGMQVRGLRPFASTFAAFFARAYDFIRMSAISQANYCLVGSHAGVSIGADGPSQMALEDLAEFRALHGSTVLYPCDATSTAALLSRMYDTKGIVYLRTTREATPVLYETGTDFRVGGSQVLRQSSNDAVAIIAAGITLHHALAAADTLAGEGIAARVIDLYSVKPLDVQTLRDAAAATGGRLLTVEDHWPEGGIGEAVSSALSEDDQRPRVKRLAVSSMPTSGTPAELMAAAGIDPDAIVNAARELVGTRG